ncbi:MAG TPA: hypothetical protein VFR23_11490 [Jiangellaceae bacterium]|nr:hypothetical protein [Jiangellaceae bacterium]
MASMMRSTQSFWAGDKFIAEGAVRPKGHPDVIPAFFEEISYEENEPETPEPEPKSSVKSKTAKS